MKLIITYTFLLAGIFIIVSCSNNKKVRNGLVEKHGILYRIGSNEAFTGTEKSIEKNRILEYHVVNGKKEGIFKISYLNGNPEMIGQLHNNKNEGVWKYYYPDGRLESTGSFSKDMPEGKWFWYYPTGGIKEEGNYIKGVSQGEWITYDTAGKVITKTYYKDGNKLNKIVTKFKG